MSSSPPCCDARPFGEWLRSIAGLWLVAGMMGVLSPAHAETQTGLSPCRQAGLPNEVLCGMLKRPLKPQDPQGQQIDIHYVVLPALSRQKHSDPIVFLAGGPGQSAIDLAPQLAALWGRGNQRRDIVLIDQRGTGRSAPLMCEEPGRVSLSEQSLSSQVARVLKCRDELAKLPYVGGPEGLRWFNTSVAVQDLDAVRQHLGAPTVNLVGGSYGTRVGLEWLRQFPHRVRRMVLDGVAPPDMALPYSSSQDAEAALEALFLACEQEALCAKRHPRLRADWDRLWRSLPQSITLSHPVDGRRETLALTTDLLASWVRGPLYMPSLAAGLPAALAAAGEGRWEGLVGLNAALSARQGTARVALGMHFSVVCAEDQPRVPPPGSASEPVRWNQSGRQLYAQVCAQWPRAEVHADFVKVPKSPSAVLIFSGGLDPITPPRHGQRIAEALGPLARHVVVANAGHGLMGVACMGDVILRFIDAADASAALGTQANCSEKIPRPPMFELPGSTP